MYTCGAWRHIHDIHIQWCARTAGAAPNGADARTRWSNRTAAPLCSAQPAQPNNCQCQSAFQLNATRYASEVDLCEYEARTRVPVHVACAAQQCFSGNTGAHGVKRSAMSKYIFGDGGGGPRRDASTSPSPSKTVKGREKKKRQHVGRRTSRYCTLFTT